MQQIFRPALGVQLAEGNTDTMYVMTHKDSNFYRIVRSRGAFPLFEARELLDEEKYRDWIFMVTDIKTLM